MNKKHLRVFEIIKDINPDNIKNSTNCRLAKAILKKVQEEKLEDEAKELAQRKYILWECVTRMIWSTISLAWEDKLNEINWYKARIKELEQVIKDKDIEISKIDTNKLISNWLAWWLFIIAVLTYIFK